MSDTTHDTQPVEPMTLFQRLYRASRDIASSRNETDIGQALMQFAASGDVHAARLLVFSDVLDGRPTTVQLREGWTIDDRPEQPYGTRLPLADFPLPDFIRADSIAICQDVETDERLNEPTRHLMAVSGLDSFVMIPLTSGQRWLGLVIIGRDTPSAFDEELIYAWWTLASQAAAALENTVLFDQVHAALEETEKQARRLTILNEMSKEMGRAEHLGEIFQIAAVKTDQALASDRVSVALLDSRGDNLNILALQGEKGAVPMGAQVPLAGSAIEIAIDENRLVSVSEAQDSDLGGMRSFLVAPLHTGGRAIGTLNVGSKQPNAYEPRDGDLVLQIAAILSSAIENKRLLEQTEQQLADLKTIQAATSALTATLSFDEANAALLPHIASVVQADRVSMFLIHGEQLTRIGTYPDREEDKELSGQTHSLSDYPLTQKVIETRQPLAIEADDPTLQVHARQAFEAVGVTANATVPLVGREGVLGTLAVSLHQPGRAFTEQEIGLLQTLADQATIVFERIRLFNQTQAAEARFRDMALSSADWVWETDAHLCYTYCSEREADVLGYPLREVLGKSPIDFMPPDEAARVDGLLSGIVARRQPIADLETQNLAKNGRQVVLQTNGVPILDENGELLGYRGVNKDVTERKQAEGALEQYAAELERRSIQLQTAAEVSRAASSILKPNELIQQVVNLVRERFDLYYAGLFLVDERGEWAVLRAGSGEAGRVQLEQAHKLEIGGDSMIGWCVAHAQARISQDVADEATRFVNPLLPDTRSEMALPLNSRGRVIGAMTIQSTLERAFSEDDISVLQTMADQLANAIDNARLFEERSERAQELAALNLIAAAVSRSIELQDLLGESLDAVIAVMDFDAGLISLRDPVTGRLYLAYQNGLPEPMVRQFERQGLAGTLCDLVYQTRESLGIGDILEGAPVDVSGLIQDGLRAYVGSPLKYQTRTLGTLCLFSRSAHDLGAAQLSLLEAMGRQIGIGIENAHLFEETQNQARREQALRETMAAINASEDLLANLPVITDHLRQMVPVDTLTLTSYNPGETEFTLLAVGAEPEGGHFAHRGMRSPLKDGAPGWVITHKQPWIDTDFRQAPTFASDKSLIAEGLASRALVPLKIGERVIGTLNLASKQPGAFTEAHLPILAQIADQMALALERARLLEQTRTALATVRATHQRYLRGEWEGLLAARPDRVWGYIDGPNGLVVADEVWTPEIEGAIAAGELTAVQERADGEKITPRSGLAVPIRLMGQTIGVLDFYDQERNWTRDDQALVEALADQVALALENQRLFEQTQRRAQREHLTGQIVSKIRAASDVQSILETAAEELGRALGVSRAVIRLGNPSHASPPTTESEGSVALATLSHSTDASTADEKTDTRAHPAPDNETTAAVKRERG
jgi:PAS domain S-box-containing protein